MEQRKLTLFLTLSFTIWFLWIGVVIPTLYPKRPEQARSKVADPLPVDALWPANVEASEMPESTPVVQLPKHAAKVVTIGSLDPDSPFLMSVELTSRGAAVEYIRLNDPRYPEFRMRHVPLKVVSVDPKSSLRLYGTSFPTILEKIPSAKLDQLHWELVKQSTSEATFQIEVDGWQLQKTFAIRANDDAKPASKQRRDTWTDGYKVDLKISAKNLRDQSREFIYEMVGPIAVPLEDAENVSKYRELRIGFTNPGSTSLTESRVTASQVADQATKKKMDIWTRPIKYVGVDVQYFAALLVPHEDQTRTQTVASSQAELVSRSSTANYSDISVRLTSAPVEVASGDSVTQGYSLYAGPKRRELLAEIPAAGIMDFGWFDWVSQLMLWMLNGFHAMGVDYGIAIILLTVIVKAALFPVSRHQAINAEIMKERQPKIKEKVKELEAKYGKNSEEFYKAHAEIAKDQSRMMLAGCLPMFLQLPIIIGLYRALNGSVDLRMVPFLWIQNLASPDAIIEFPFVIPLLGWRDFNILPFVTIAMFIVQQKLTMPPPADEEAAAQMKMMNVMMIVMGVLFYRVSAGLCIYFIASSVWGLVERWIMKRWGLNKPTPPASPATTTTAAPTESKPSAVAALWSKLQEAADKEGSVRNNGANDSNRGNAGGSRDDSSRKNKKNKKRR